MSKERLPKERFSQPLRDAMAKIETVLKEHDCMGLIVLQSPQHTEFMLCITDQSWSIFEWLPPGPDGKTGINMKFRKVNRANSEFCMGSVWSFRRITKVFALFFDSLANKAESKMEIDITMGDVHNEGRPQ